MNILYADPSKIIKRKDSVQYINFADTSIKKDRTNTLVLYKIIYPKTIEEKDTFYKKINTLASRLLINKRSLNLVLPADLIIDVDNTLANRAYPQEEIYSKYASDLTDEERSMMEDEYVIDYPEDYGEIQGYLNCQAYYWLEYLGRSDAYEPTRNYTEMDKSLLMREAINKRKELLRSFYVIRDNAVIEVNKENVSKTSSIVEPIYTSQEILEKIGTDKIRSNIVILQYGARESIYKGKMTLIDGIETDKVKDYKFYTEITDKKDLDSLFSLIDNKDLKISSLKNFSIYQLQNVNLKRATVRKNEPQRSTIVEKTDTAPIWRIDK